jgi:hypothetical protein
MNPGPTDTQPLDIPHYPGGRKVKLSKDVLAAAAGIGYLMFTHGKSSACQQLAALSAAACKTALDNQNHTIHMISVRQVSERT